MSPLSVKPSPEARRLARGLAVALCEVEVGTANLFGHLDIQHLIGPVDEAPGGKVVVGHDALERVVQTLVATGQTLMLLSTSMASLELGTDVTTPQLLERRRFIMDTAFDAAGDF
jgi:hypothetical protein